MTPFLNVPDPHDRPARLRDAAATRRLARQARTRSPERSARRDVDVPGNEPT